MLLGNFVTRSHPKLKQKKPNTELEHNDGPSFKALIVVVLETCVFIDAVHHDAESLDKTEHNRYWECDFNMDTLQ